MNYITIYKDEDLTPLTQPGIIAEFLYNNLDEFRDELIHIQASISHALGKTGVPGGFIIVAMENDEILGALVMNRTGMSGFIPENILVYVAVRSDTRGRGIGRILVEKALALAEGDVKLHVEYNNPAKRLYERIGFTSKYAEMRFHKRK